MQPIKHNKNMQLKHHKNLQPAKLLLYAASVIAFTGIPFTVGAAEGDTVVYPAPSTSSAQTDKTEATAPADLPPDTSSAQTGKKWSLDLTLEVLAARMSGDVTVKGITAGLNVGFDKVLEHLKIGGMGAVRVGYDRWALNTEIIYVDLGASKGPASVTLQQWMVEPTLRYRVCDYFEALAGARYNNLGANLSVSGPLVTPRAASGTVDWCDPIIGGIVQVPLSRKFSINVHGDIGGFGVGSYLTWQAYPYLNWQISRRCALQAGYRWLFIDYSQGSGTSKFRYDILEQGPQIAFTLQF